MSQDEKPKTAVDVTMAAIEKAQEKIKEAAEPEEKEAAEPKEKEVAATVAPVATVPPATIAPVATAAPATVAPVATAAPLATAAPEAKEGETGRG